MCRITNEPKHFVWANCPDANLKEPIESLKQQGWKYGDVPTASNFNWLFNNVMTQMNSISAIVEELQAEKVLIGEAFHIITNLNNTLVEKSNAHGKALKEICTSLSDIVEESKKHISNYRVSGLPSNLSIPLPIPTNRNEDDREK